MRVLERAWNLVRGVLGGWLARRERRNPEAVYEAAIDERVRQYTRLREAAAGILYLRGKLAAEHRRASDELTRVTRQLEIAVDGDDDAAALALIGRRDALVADVERRTGELTELTTEADAAKKNLVQFQDEILRLRDEKVRMLARLANAKARLRLQTTLGALSPEADIRALEGVREHVEQIVAETRIGRDLGDADLDVRLDRIREAEAEAARRAQLGELKRARKRDLLPMVLASDGPRAREPVPVPR